MCYLCIYSGYNTILHYPRRLPLQPTMDEILSPTETNGFGYNNPKNTQLLTLCLHVVSGNIQMNTYINILIHT